MFEKLEELISKELELLTLKIQNQTNINAKNEWYKELGEQYCNVVNKYAISDNEALSILESIGEYVTQTRITNIDCLLFKDGDKNKPIIPSIRKFNFEDYGIKPYFDDRLY